MKTNIKKLFSILILSFIAMITISISGVAASSEIVYPLKKISKLECRFQDFSSLSANCKENLPVLQTSDYKKYAKQNGGYNKYTRLYTVLWGASYKYGWDVGYGGHMGVDIATAKGTPIYAMADGEVIIASRKTGLGKMVAIRHRINGKTIVSNYGHMSKIIATKGQKVRAGDLIGEVGSTGMSTGNHLHFQIDIKTNFSPIYYNAKTCPYKYYTIVEQGVCFSELEKITIDPLKFLETSGAILSSVEVSTTKIDPIKTTNTSNHTTVTVNTSSINRGDIFDRTVYVGYSNGDIRNVQQIYKALGYYNGEITSNYRDVEEAVIKYQLDKGVIANRNDDGAGWFGPKTRRQTKKDWNRYIKNGGKIATVDIPVKGNNNNQNVVTVKTEKIERRNMMTREEIEAKEVQDFLRDFTIDLRFVNPGGNVEKGETEILKLDIKDARGRPFRGNMPGAMTFIANTKTISVFPEKLYYFTDGKRDIHITGIGEGNTKLYIKVGNVTIKTFHIKVYNGKKTITPIGARIITPNTAVMGDSAKGIGIFTDKRGKYLVNLAFTGKFTLTASNGNKVCIKRGNIQDVKRIYKSQCREADFKEKIEFSYQDTVGGLLIFDFKTLNDNAKFEIVSSRKKSLASRKVNMGLPKGLTRDYQYKDEVMQGIKTGIATSGIKRGYFMQDRDLTEADAYAWLKSSLALMKTEASSSRIKRKIESNIQALNRKKGSANKTLTKLEFLALNYKYLVFNPESKNITLNFRDLTEAQNKIANTIFNTSATWKDRFGTTHFRPNDTITRGEGAYMIVKTIENANGTLLTFK